MAWGSGDWNVSLGQPELAEVTGEVLWWFWVRPGVLKGREAGSHP